ncbi:MAG: hypothetical protein ACREOH_05570, partial [Candidatus Entotheonellia bacterium]
MRRDTRKGDADNPGPRGAAMTPERREYRRIPPSWEAYLTGRVEAEPHGVSWVREQLTFYGLLQPDTLLPQDRRRSSAPPKASPPSPALPTPSQPPAPLT